MAKERLYIIADRNGAEQGPFDQETLCRMAESGRIDLTFQVRSTLLTQWDAVANVSFLKPYFQKQLEAIAAAQERGLWKWLRRRATLRLEEKRLKAGTLGQTRSETAERADLLLRTVTVLTDLLIVALLLVAVLLGCSMLLRLNMLSAASFSRFYIVGAWAIIMIYHVILPVNRRQTLGEQFWGVCLVRSNGREVYYLRRLVYLFLTLCFGLFTPFHMRLSLLKRSWQELLTGSKMMTVKKLRKKKAA